MSKVMITTTLVGGPSPWPSRTMTIGLLDDGGMPDAVVAEVRHAVRSLLAGVASAEPEPEEEAEPDAPEPTALGLGL